MAIYKTLYLTPWLLPMAPLKEFKSCEQKAFLAMERLRDRTVTKHIISHLQHVADITVTVNSLSNYS